MPLQGPVGRRKIAAKQRRSQIRIQIIVGSLVIFALYAAGFLLIVGKNQTIEVKHRVEVERRINEGNLSSNVGKGGAASPIAKHVFTAAGGETIGWAVTITGCGSDPITEGAAVLKHAIHLTSIHGNLGGRYDYKMYAIYHPDGEACALTLKDLGYELIQRETPVAVKDIEGKFLRETIVSLQESEILVHKYKNILNGFACRLVLVLFVFTSKGVKWVLRRKGTCQACSVYFDRSPSSCTSGS